MTKKQHYVPQFYLRNFTSDDNKLWVFDRVKEEYYFRTPKEVCYEKYLYETPWKDEDPKLGKFVLENQIENYFADKEGEYSPLLKRIIDICRNPQNKNALICNHEEKEMLASFVANIFVRNPWSLRQIESDLPLEELKENEEIQAIEQIIQIMGLGDIDSLVKAADKRVWLTEEFEFDGSRLVPRILEMNYTFLVSNGEPFITSSFPAIYELCDTEERGLMPGNIYLPVHPQIALLYNGTIPKMKSNRLKTVGEEIVHELNSVYLKSDVEQMRFLIARDKESLRTVIEKEH